MHEFLHPMQIMRELADTGRLGTSHELQAQMREQAIAVELKKIPGRDFPDVIGSGASYDVELKPPESVPAPQDPVPPVDPIRYGGLTRQNPSRLSQLQEVSSISGLKPYDAASVRILSRRVIAREGDGNGFGDLDAPYGREAVSDGASSPPFGGTAPTPAFQPDAVYSPDGYFIGNFPRVSAAAAPSTTAFNGSGSDSAPRMAGDFNALGQSVARLLSGAGQFVGTAPAKAASQPGPLSPTLTAPNQRAVYPSQVSVFDTGASAVPFAPSDDANYSGGLLGKLAAVPAGVDLRNPNQPAPPPDEETQGVTSNRPVRSLARSDRNNFPAYPSDTSASAAPSIPPDSVNVPGNFAGWLAALAGVDPQNPTQAARSPLDDQLRDFYRDDPAWFLQLRR